MGDYLKSNTPPDIQAGVVKPFHVSEPGSQTSNEGSNDLDPKNSVFGFANDNGGEKIASSSNTPESDALINAMEKEKMQSEKLFSVMMEEAGKLRLWQQHSEYEKQKLREEIKYARATISGLRKGLFESQQKGERNSQKMLQDQINYQEINRKLALTQEQMTVVKSQFEVVRQYIENFQSLKNHFKAQNDERVMDIEVICEKFDQVNQEHQDQIKELNELRRYELDQLESEFNAQLRRAENHLTKLQEALNQSKAKEESLSQQQADLQQKIENLNTEKGCYESEIEKLKTEKDQALLNIKYLEERIKELEISHAELIETKKELASSLDEAKLSKEIINSLQNKVYHDGNAFIKERENLQIDIDKEKLRCEMISKELRDCEEERDNTSEQLKLIQKELDNKNSEMAAVKQEKSELEEELDGFKKKLNEKEQEIKELQDSISQKELDFKLEISNLNKSVETLNLTKDDLEIKLRDAENKEYTRSIEITKLESQLHEVVKEKGDLKGEIRDLKQQQETLGNRFEKLGLNCKQLEQNKKELEHDNKQIKMELDTTQYTVKELRSEKDDLEEKVESLTQENADLKEQIAELEESLGTKTESVEYLEQELESLKLNLENKTKRDKTYAHANETKIKNLKTDLEAKTKTIKALEKDVKTWEEKTKSQTKEISKLERSLEEKNNDLDEKATQLDKLLSETEAFNDKNEALKFEHQMTLKNLEADKAKLVAEKDEMINFYDMKEKTYQRDISKKDAELEEYKKKVSEADRISAQDDMKEAELKKLRKEKQELEAENRKCDMKLSAVEEELKTLKSDLMKLKALNFENVTQIQHYQQEANTAELKLRNFENLESQLKEAKQLEVNLRDEIAKLKMQKPMTISQVLHASSQRGGDDLTKIASQIKELKEKPEEIAKVPFEEVDIHYNSSGSSSPGQDVNVYLANYSKGFTGNKRKLPATSSKLQDAGKKVHIASSSNKPTETTTASRSSAKVKLCPPKSTSVQKPKATRKLFQKDNKRLGSDWVDDEYDFDNQ